MRATIAVLAYSALIAVINVSTLRLGLCQTQPTTVDYSGLAFYPDRWKEHNVPFQLFAWEGEQIFLLTVPANYNPRLMSQFVARLDAGWKTYETLVGESPKEFRQINGKPTICALPKSNLSCGYGCGYVGRSGIEVAGFYDKDLPAFLRNPRSFPHYYFYEMGRNYFVFGDRHSLFTTGYAVFMRYVCMDALNCQDPGLKNRRIIESCEELYVNSNLSFLDAFTNLGTGEKTHRLINPVTRKPLVPSDQPVMYASAMLKMRRHFGGDKWVKDFLHALHECPEVKATDQESALEQALNWFVCASVAAKRDLTPVFVDRWRMPMTPEQLEIVKGTDWADEEINVAELVNQLSTTPK